MTDDPRGQGLVDEDEEPDVPTDPIPIQPDDPKPGSGEDDGSTTEPEA